MWTLNCFHMVMLTSHHIVAYIFNSLWQFNNYVFQRSEKNDEQIRKLIRRLHNLCVHPNAHKRLSAAIAFNSFYKIFRYLQLLQQFWMTITWHHSYAKNVYILHEEYVNTQIKLVPFIFTENHPFVIKLLYVVGLHTHLRNNLLSFRYGWKLFILASTQECSYTTYKYIFVSLGSQVFWKVVTIRHPPEYPDSNI